MQVVIYEVFIGRYWCPLIVVNIHLLAGAVVNTAKNVDVIIEIASAMKEASEGHRRQLNELKSLHV